MDEAEGQASATAEELERMQHAKDYRLYNETHGEMSDLFVEPDAPPDMSAAENREEGEKGVKGVFVPPVCLSIK